ncbi:MAG: response regulator [Candidatus Babeliaceae bacterium]|nr:response regulator [Candidatus Babeliaceae bacterium]
MILPVILCVDDEIAVLDNLRDQLKKHFGKSYRYEFAQSAKEAWEVIEEIFANGQKIVLIIADWLMPDVKGDMFLIEVHKRYPKIINVMLTGLTKDDAVEHAQKYADLFHRLHKPWHEKELINTVHAALEKSSHKEEAGQEWSF